jgi:DNA polymerase-4
MSVTDTASIVPLRWLYVDFNSYFASVEQQHRPETQGKPLIVVPVDSDYTSAIAASYEAKALGISTNTRVADAKRICPDIHIVLARHDLYVETHKRIIEEAHQHIPVTQICSIDEVACRLMRNEQSVEAVSDIAMRMKAGLARHIGAHIRCSIGVAPNKYLAKVATDLQKPDGFTVVQASDIEARLATLRLSDLPGIGRNMEARLHRSGIYTVPQLWRLSPKHMRKIWHSVWGEKLWYLMRGHDIPDVETTRSTVGHSHVLAPELRPVSRAYDVARRLTMKAASRLRRLEHHASGMHVSFRLEQGARYGAHAEFPAASNTHFMLHCMHQLWQELVRQTGAVRVKKVSVTLYKLRPCEAHHAQMGLFAEAPNHRKQDSISKAMDTINQKFGRDTVLQGMLPNQGKSFTGTKIAFNRIPELREFQD